jgi:hypothetical protein
MQSYNLDPSSHIRCTLQILIGGACMLRVFARKASSSSWMQVIIAQPIVHALRRGEPDDRPRALLYVTQNSCLVCSLLHQYSGCAIELETQALPL